MREGDQIPPIPKAQSVMVRLGALQPPSSPQSQGASEKYRFLDPTLQIVLPGWGAVAEPGLAESRYPIFRLPDDRNPDGDFFSCSVNGPRFLDNDKAVPLSVLYRTLCPVGHLANVT